jgi:pilus assembly protein Flp/PilA
MFDNFTNAIWQFLREEDGPTAVEYAVIVALILAVCITGFLFLGRETNESMDSSSVAISGAFLN